MTFSVLSVTLFQNGKWEMENAWWRAFGIFENICILKHKKKIRDSFVKEREVWGNIAENSDLRKEFF